MLDRGRERWLLLPEATIGSLCQRPGDKELPFHSSTIVNAPKESETEQKMRLRSHRKSPFLYLPTCERKGLPYPSHDILFSRFPVTSDSEALTQLFLVRISEFKILDLQG